MISMFSFGSHPTPAQSVIMMAELLAEFIACLSLAGATLF